MTMPHPHSHHPRTQNHCRKPTLVGLNRYNAKWRDHTILPPSKQKNTNKVTLATGIQRTREEGKQWKECGDEKKCPQRHQTILLGCCNFFFSPYHYFIPNELFVSITSTVDDDKQPRNTTVCSFVLTRWTKQLGIDGLRPSPMSHGL